jgi:hypothetical protein
VPQRALVVLGEFGTVLRLGLMSMLEEQGYRVLGEGGFSDDYAGADAVLIDLDSPSCADDARRLLESLPELRVIGCSARRLEIQRFSKAGPSERRPLEPGVLQAAIERWP